MAQLQLISYDLVAPGRNYEPLYEAIKAYPVWAKILDSVWILDTQSTSIQVRDHLRQYIDANDLLYVVKISDWASAGPMSQEVRNWLAARPV